MEKIRVYGKAQNRTVLGIMHAYMIMYPQATLADLKKAFPNELNPDKGVPEIFVYQGDNGTDANWNGYFQKDDEVLTTGDGKKVAVVSMWTKPSFERAVEFAKQYGIVVAKFEEAGKVGQKGGFKLEYLNGYVPPVPKKKGIPSWLWIILALLIIGLILLLMKTCGNKEAEPKVVEKVVLVHDTLYVKQFEELEENFNAAQFEQNSAVLKDEAKFVLHDLAKLMEKNPEVKLRIVGHTSEEGDPVHNQKLSEERAKAAVDFLIEQGISKDRLEYEGKGSSEPLEPGNHEKNRRTEFEVIK